MTTTGNTLPSSVINVDSLHDVDDVIEKYPKLKGESKAGTLAVKLAKEALFGDAVLKQCTPAGSRELPGLPTAELFQLKKVIFKLFPQYRNSPVEFEPLWKRSLDAVEQACKRLRSKSL